MKVKKKKLGSIQPEAVQFDSKARVDAARGIVKNVKILGMESRHGYRYSPTALKNAVELYEGVRVNIDHPDRKTPGAARSYLSRFGSLKNVRFVEGDGLRGDHHFNPQHTIAKTYAWDADNDPSACGFSHNAKGPLVEGRDGLVCESIEAVRSVDLVADAATTASLFEGKPRMKIRKKRTKLSPEGKNKVRRLLFQRFGRQIARQLIEDMGGVEQAAPLAMPPEGGESDNVEALIALIRKVLANPNITAEESIKQVTKRLKALKDMIPGGSAKDAGVDPALAGMEGDEDDDDEDEDDRLESRGKSRRRKKDEEDEPDDRLEGALSFIEGMQRREAITELCDEQGFKPTAKQRKLLEGMDDDEAREALIESWVDDSDNPRKRTAAKPKSKELQEGKKGDGTGEAFDPKKWARGLRA